ncbi:hypothetical protein [Dictyobacter vulcani]|uniref:hypothetical protein n=1 Tax=Dictyobacter vulcani TaxID=2607529 RepID=UPI001387064E|nr:hypothetical protein [Dictyobacter vulcani]
MLLYLHPTRCETITASGTTLTRWALITNSATILAQVSMAPAIFFEHRYDH